MPRPEGWLQRRRRVGVVIAVLATTVLLSPDAARGAHRPAPRNQLPMLGVVKSPDLYVGLATDPPKLVGPSGSQEILYGCDPYEVKEHSAQRCLRFDTIVLNAGAGPLELRYDAAGAVSSMRARQRIYRSDGSSVDRAAGFFYYDPAHAHFHYADFAQASLWRSDARGRRLGSAPVKTGRKDGFCLEDLDAYRVEAGGQGYTFPSACYPGAQPDGSIAQVNGITPGWVDIYDLTLTNQSIEITGVADGYYLLQITVDPTHTLLLDARSRTGVSQLIRLCGNQAEMIGSGGRQCSGHPSTPAMTGQRWRTVCASGWCPNLPRTGWASLGRLFP